MAELRHRATDELRDMMKDIPVDVFNYPLGADTYIKLTKTEDISTLEKIKEVCKGLALSDRARALRYDKIVEILREEK